MKVDELQALARAVQPILAPAEGHDGRAQVLAYNDLVYRFRELITRAHNSLLKGQVVEPALKQELRILARAIPAARAMAEASLRGKRPGSGHEASLSEAARP